MIATSRQRRFLLFLGAAVLAALLFRIAAAAALVEHPSVVDPDPRTDMATYQRLAGEICRGDWPEEFYYQPFYYAVFLPAVYRVCGQGAWAVPAVQALLGAAAVGFAGLTAARLFGRRAGVLAALLLALSRMAVFYTPFCLIAELQLFLLSLFAWTMTAAVCRGGPARWAGAALVLSCAVLTRGNTLLLAPVPLVLLIRRILGAEPAAVASERRYARAAKAAAGSGLFLLVLFLPQVPFSVQNFRTTGRWTGPSTAAGAVLALSNSPQAPPGGLAPDTPVFEEWMRQAKAPPAARVPVARQVAAWIARSPAAFAELKLQTLLLFWSSLEIPNNVSLAYEGEGVAVLHLPFPFLLDFNVLGTLGLAGLFLSGFKARRSRRVAACWAAAWLYCAATVAFYMLARFRLPVLPLLCVFGGFALERVLRLAAGYLHGRRDLRARFLTVAGAFAASAYLCNAAFLHYQRIEPAVMRLVRPCGTVFPYGEGLMMQDHGPRLTGGWRAVENRAQPVVLRKTFRVPPRYRKAGRCRVRIETALFVGEGRPVRWIREQTQVAVGGDGRFAVALRLSPGARPMVDTHRKYGRTRLEGARAPPGEAVVRVVLFDDP